MEEPDPAGNSTQPAAPKRCSLLSCDRLARPPTVTPRHTLGRHRIRGRPTDPLISHPIDEDAHIPLTPSPSVLALMCIIARARTNAKNRYWANFCLNEQAERRLTSPILSRVAGASAAVPCSAGTGVFRLLHSEFSMRKPLAMAASQSASRPPVRSVPSGP